MTNNKTLRCKLSTFPYSGFSEGTVSLEGFKFGIFQISYTCNNIKFNLELNRQQLVAIAAKALNLFKCYEITAANCRSSRLLYISNIPGKFIGCR